MCPFTSINHSCPHTAVRTGNLAKFNQVLDQFGEKFQTDGTYTLIIRLRHNVIKTGMGLGLTRMQTLSFSHRQPHGSVGGDLSMSLRPSLFPLPGVRMISLSYSRISLADIAQKLQLDSPEDAEFIVAKVGFAMAKAVTFLPVRGSGSRRELARGPAGTQSHQETPVTVAEQLPRVQTGPGMRVGAEELTSMSLTGSDLSSLWEPTGYPGRCD